MNKFYIGTGRKLSDSDFTRISKKSGISEAKLRAVNEVEARGTGSYSTGALVCLYEPHIAYRKTSGQKRHRLIQAGLAYQKWGEKKYPKSSFKRIDECAKLAGEEVAALSTSWGLGQIMGFNHKALGFNSALEMVKWFAESEANQLEGMVRFIKSNAKMHQALLDGEWAVFARSYNGAGYAKNKYHTKLAAAFKKWKAKAPSGDTETKIEQIKPRPKPKPISKQTKPKPTGTAKKVGIIGAFLAIVYAALKYLGVIS